MSDAGSSNGGGRTVNLSMRQVKELLSMDDCISIQEEVFRQNGEGTAWNGPNAWIFPNAEVMTHPGTGKMMWSYDPESWKDGRPANVGFQHWHPMPSAGCVVPQCAQKHASTRSRSLSLL